MANKTAATIKLIQVLSARGEFISTSELADMIDTNPRNVKEYIKEIEVCGYRVDSLAGVYGGYRMNKASLLPAINLSQDEIKMIRDTTSYLASKNDYFGVNEIDSIFGKILASLDDSKPITPLTMVDKFPLSMTKEELQKRFTVLNDGIESQYKVEIEYLSVAGKVKNHVIHPYKLFVYNGNWFVIAYNETVNDIGYFKLNRINNLYLTRSHFTVLKTYVEEDYLDGYGMVKNGEYYHVELELTNLNTVMKERIYGKNQNVVEIDDRHVRFSADMQNQEMILSFVLSFGNKCKVLEPEWLKEKVKETIREELALYE